MLGRISSSILIVSLFSCVSLFGDCSKGRAGFLPTQSLKSDDTLLNSENDGAKPSIDEVSACTATSVQLGEIPVPSPDRPQEPLTRRNLLTAYLGIFNGHDRPSSGAGNSSNNTSGSFSQPLLGAIADLVSLQPGMGYANVDPDAIPLTSMATRLFRPPRHT